MKGFIDCRIDVVVKFGGSLLSDINNCKAAVNNLVKSSEKGFRILVIPGGGPTDNTIEEIDSIAKFHANTHHLACARAQDQTGLMISDIFFSTKLSPCEDLEQVKMVLDQGNVAVLLPSKIIFALDPFERIWDITSDSMGAWFSWLVRCNKFVVYTNVNGIFVNADTENPESHIAEISAENLVKMGHTSVDACVADFLLAHNITMWVINGKNKHCLSSLIKGEKNLGTKVYA